MADINLPVPGSDFNTWGEKLNNAVAAVNDQGEPANVRNIVSTDIDTLGTDIEGALSAKIAQEASALEVGTVTAGPLDVTITGTAPERVLNFAIPSGNVLQGSGIPEGVVTASPGAVYSDTAVTRGAALWRKATGVGNTGWVVTNGDTGTRDVESLLVNGWARQAYDTDLARVGNRVSFDAYLNLTSTTAALVLTLPVGFRPSGWRYGTVTRTGSNGTTLITANINGSIAAPYYTGIGGSAAFLHVDFETSDPWPTTLPGIPA